MNLRLQSNASHQIALKVTTRFDHKLSNSIGIELSCGLGTRPRIDKVISHGAVTSDGSLFHGAILISEKTIQFHLFRLIDFNFAVFFGWGKLKEN